MSGPEIRDARFGLMVTIAGALMFVPDALIVRVIQAHTLDIAILRGVIACVVTAVGVLLFARHTMPTRADF